MEKKIETTLTRGNIGEYIGILEKKMETTSEFRGFRVLGFSV